MILEQVAIALDHGWLLLPQIVDKGFGVGYKERLRGGDIDVLLVALLFHLRPPRIPRLFVSDTPGIFSPCPSGNAANHSPFLF
jgi:hypothetical protein